MKILLLATQGMDIEISARHLRASYNVPYIAVNKLIDAEIRKLTKLGQQAESLRATGQPLDDAMILGMIQRQVRRSAAKEGFILQGFPHTAAQAQALDDVLSASRQALQVAVWLTPAIVAPTGIKPVEDPVFAYYRASSRLHVLPLPTSPAAAVTVLDGLFDKLAAGVLPKGIAKPKKLPVAPSVTRAKSAVTVPGKRPVGRPRKNPVQAPVQLVVAREGMKRPVGRPPKSATAVRTPVVARAQVKPRRVKR
jgi:hypothetical protein